MLTPGQENYDPMIEKTLSVLKKFSPDDSSLIGYLQRQVEEKDRLIQTLYQQIGMLEAKNQMLEEQLELASKGGNCIQCRRFFLCECRLNKRS